MAQDRESKMNQNEVYAEQLSQKYISYYRQLAQALAQKATAPSLSSSPVTPTVAVAPIQKSTVQNYDTIPGETVTVTYGLNGMEGLLQNPAGVLVLGAMAMGAFALSEKR